MQKNRRNCIKLLSGTSTIKLLAWSTPGLWIVNLPAHAQMSPMVCAPQAMTGQLNQTESRNVVTQLSNNATFICNHTGRNFVDVTINADNSIELRRNTHCVFEGFDPSIGSEIYQTVFTGTLNEDGSAQTVLVETNDHPDGGRQGVDNEQLGSTLDVQLAFDCDSGEISSIQTVYTAVREADGEQFQSQSNYQ